MPWEERGAIIEAMREAFSVPGKQSRRGADNGGSALVGHVREQIAPQANDEAERGLGVYGRRGRPIGPAPAQPATPGPFHQ